MLSRRTKRKGGKRANDYRQSVQRPIPRPKKTKKLIQKQHPPKPFQTKYPFKNLVLAYSYSCPPQGSEFYASRDGLSFYKMSYPKFSGPYDTFDAVGPLVEPKTIKNRRDYTLEHPLASFWIQLQVREHILDFMIKYIACNNQILCGVILSYLTYELSCDYMGRCLQTNRYLESTIHEMQGDLDVTNMSNFLYYCDEQVSRKINSQNYLDDLQISKLLNLGYYRLNDYFANRRRRGLNVAPRNIGSTKYFKKYVPGAVELLCPTTIMVRKDWQNYAYKSIPKDYDNKISNIDKFEPPQMMGVSDCFLPLITPLEAFSLENNF